MLAVPLNPSLYQALCRTFGQPRITNQGSPMNSTVLPRNTLQGHRLSRQIYDWGETYCVCCPFCCDSRFRLWINHCWAQRDTETGDDNLHLATCYNEECLSKREPRKQLHAMVYPDGRWAACMELPAPPKSVWLPPASPTPPPGSSIADLPPEHPACVYLAERGFDVQVLARRYGVLFTDPTRDSRPPLNAPHIVIPIEMPATGLDATQGATTCLAGWQARIIGSQQDPRVPKYLTGTNTRKSKLLYGLPHALGMKGPVILVEGVMDAWKIGPGALAMLGKTLSSDQLALITRHFAMRRVIVWLDADATEDAAKVRDQIMNSRNLTGDPADVVVATAPKGRKDPGECTPAQIKDVLARASAPLKRSAQRGRGSR